MLQSKLFTKTSKQLPKDEVSQNAQLLLRAGFIHKEMAGVYSLMPLGLKVVNNIKKIVAEEMERIGSEEIIMSTLQTKEVWEKTGRWDDEKVDVWFKSQLKNGNEVGFGWSHEEPIIEMMKSFVSSYNDLPAVVHQFQNKLRNEVRAKSGIIRCREFVMKDMYAFCATDEANMDFYNQATEAYLRVFRRVGLGDITYVTSASGGVFTDKFSHEFQTICESGEDVIYVNKGANVAVNKEIYNEETLKKMGMKMRDFKEKKAAEVGNIFNFGTSKCEQMGLYYNDKDGSKKLVHLSSYGIGITRLMGVLAEILHDENGIIWPKELAPFDIHLLSVGNDEKAARQAEEWYARLSAHGFDVLFDDRTDVTAGAKFADADLIGIPYRIVISAKTVEQNSAEVKLRSEKEARLVSFDKILEVFK
jgi:prolyl-tRNA synthetase